MDTHLPAEARAGTPPEAERPQPAVAYFDMFGTIHVFDARIAAHAAAPVGVDWSGIAARALGRLRRVLGGAAAVALPYAPAREVISAAKWLADRNGPLEVETSHGAAHPVAVEDG